MNCVYTSLRRDSQGLVPISEKEKDYGKQNASGDFLRRWLDEVLYRI